MKVQYISIDGVKYTIKTKRVNTGSNYNTSIQVFETGANLPVCGTITKHDHDFKLIAKHLIKSVKQNEVHL